MDKSHLHKIFSKSFNHSEWIEVLKDVFGANQLLAQPRQISLPNNDKARAAYELGNFTTSDDRIIGLYKIEINENVWLERNKVGLRELLRKVYDYDVDGAIIVFEQNQKWRLSFVSEIKVLNDEGEVIEQATEPKRYTYLLGEDEKVRTPSDRLSKLVGKTLALNDILEAFSVEALNEEFYKIIAHYFYQLIGGTIGKGKKATDFGDGILQLPSVPKTNRLVYQEFAVRLIGRTIFSWFLKMKKSEAGKELLPESLLSSKAVKVNSGYYHTILERMFFQTLNTKMENRIENLPKGCEQIPFLNGGLFEPDTDDYYRPNNITGISENINTLKITDDWFLKLFTELEKYNFTIDENSVTDVEVSVDPEMLGRIFENLLAEIDPDSGETARKATGSFYTPREIVDYMATESLVQYLHNKTNLKHEQLRPVFKMTEEKLSQFSETELESILNSLDKIKILDPACGSGAFPMGVLQKIVMALQKLDPDATWWKERQVKRITNQYVRKALREKLEDSSVEYARKIGVIQNSLYGVDIQPIAAEISKLRCFLSLVVDETINENKPNRGIEPLPNLEFKFVTADTLQKLPVEKDLGGLFNSNDDIEKLEDLRNEYLQSSGKKKETIKQQFLNVQKKMFTQQVHLFQDTNSRAYKLSTWNPFNHEKADWFDPKWMYGVANFDVVIGNPPYRIMTKNNTPIQILNNYINLYPTIKNSSSKNLFIPFIERGVQILSHDGVQSLIVPEGLFKTRSYNDCVDYLNDNGSVISITTFTSMVFENAVTGSLVFVFSNNKDNLTQKFHFDKNYVLSIKEEEDTSSLDKIDSVKGVFLKDCCNLFKGMVVADRKNVVGEEKEYGNDIFLLGKSIEKWKIKRVFYTEYTGLTIVGGTKRKSKHDVFPRILIRRTGDSLCCSLLNEKALTESTLYSCWPKTDSFRIKYIIALLNSSLLTYYIKQRMITNKQAFPQILMTDLGELPIPEISQEKQLGFEVLSDFILYCVNLNEQDQINPHVPNSHIAKLFEEVIDAMVMELYFEEDFKKACIEFIRYAERDFKAIEHLKTEEEKIEVIHEAYQKLRQKDNEIRNNLKLMDIKLADIVMPIKTVR